MPEKIVYNNRRIMPFVESTFRGPIHVANPMHPDAVTSGCDIGGSTTSSLSGICHSPIESLFSHVYSNVPPKFWSCFDAGFSKGNKGRLLSELAATSIYKS